MKFEEPKNPNYCATVVTLKTFVDLPNCDRIKASIIFSNSVIVPKDAKIGDIGLFFPVECQLSAPFLAANNLYRKPEWGNVDPTKSGFFEAHGRIKCVRFRTHKSEGFWIPLSSLDPLQYGGYDPKDFPEGTTFDRLENKNCSSDPKDFYLEICCKYVPKGTNSGGPNHVKGESSLKERIVEGQWRFHTDTENLKKNIHKIHPDDYISISEKFHGTSAIFSKILVKRKLNLLERLLNKIGVKIQLNEYGFTYSSRKVIKNVAGVGQTNDDVWRVIAKTIEDIIPNSYSVFGEIVGYTPGGKAIQCGPGGKPYHYGCSQGECQLYVYKVTSTNPDGKVIELSWPQMKEFCTKYGLEMVKELYYGKADQFFSWDTDIQDDPDDIEWRKALLQEIESQFVHDQMCPWNGNTVPAEGIVVRLDHLEGKDE